MTVYKNIKNCNINDKKMMNKKVNIKKRNRVILAMETKMLLHQIKGFLTLFKTQNLMLTKPFLEI